MKLKGVNPIEQHIEKIVLVAVSAIFLVVVAAQFLFEPNLVKVGQEDAVRPGQAFRGAEALAQQLKAKMDATNVELPPVPDVNLVDQFKNRIRGPVAPRATIVSLGNDSVIHGKVTVADTKMGSDRLAPLAIPAPAKVAVAAFASTIDPTEPVNNPELKKLLPPEQPMDKHAVSVEARFDGAALSAALRQGGEQGAPVPVNWWRDMIEILGVQLERQEQTASGSWGEAVTVPPAPGRESVAEQLKTVKSTAELADVIAEARAIQEDILRPAYYRTIAGHDWAPPSVMAVAMAAGPKGEPRNPEVARLVKEIADADRTLETQKKLREDIMQRPTKTDPRGGGGAGGGGGKGGAGGAPQGPANAPNAMPQAEKDRRIKQIDGVIEREEKKRKEAEDKLKAMGLDAAGKPLQEGGAPEPGQPVEAVKPLLENNDIKLWAHDLTAEPGKVYRYRVRVALANPLFARTSALVAEQQDLAKSPVALSEPSEWSEPVEVLSDQYYFITSASVADAFAPSRAGAEVYRFFYGYYRKAAISVEPGDVIAANIKLPDPAKLPIYDVTKPTEPNPAAAPEAPGFPAPGSGGKGRQPIGPGVPPGQAPGQPEKVPLPTNAKPWPKPTIQAATDVMLLDVARSPGASDGGGPRAEAYLRAGDGQIITRAPDQDKRAAAYALVSQSAKEGETQGQPAQPKPEAEKPAPIRPPTRDPYRPPAPGPGGGGGGGGGG